MNPLLTKARPLELADRIWLEPKILACSSPFSEYSFANLFLFRDLHQYQICQESEHSPLLIAGITRNQQRYLMPIGPNLDLFKSEIEVCLQDRWAVFPLTLEQSNQLVANCKIRVTSSLQINESDYLYSVSALASMQGRALSAKRNQLKHFQEQYSCSFEPLTEANREAAKQVLAKWAEPHQEATDESSVLAALQLQEALGLVGYLLYVDKEPVGFVLGEVVGHSFLLHFAKGDLAFEGVYPELYQNLAEQLLQKFPSVEWINMEQDLGDLGLRQSKHSYHPEKLLGQKFLVCNRGS